jgi:hypothetical protein
MKLLILYFILLLSRDKDALAMRRYVSPLLIKHGVLFFLVGCERGQRSRFLAKRGSRRFA